MGKMFNFKAIETLYRGHRFRSRLEARWACFFDALGISWEYEGEGYVLEGVKYLPDFWLPEQECFVEIKGQEPTMEEKIKARLLSLYTRKRVCIFYGAIDFPEIVNQLWAQTKALNFFPPMVWKFPTSQKYVGGHLSEPIDVPTSVLALMQHLKDYELQVFVHEILKHVVIASATEYYPIGCFDQMLKDLDRQREGLQKYATTIEEMEDDIKDALTLDPGWKLHFNAQLELEFDDGCIWMECKHCGNFDIRFPTNLSHDCNKDEDEDETFRADTPRLLAAYTAARSARFEFGEKGS